MGAVLSFAVQAHLLLQIFDRILQSTNCTTETGLKAPGHLDILKGQHRRAATGDRGAAQHKKAPLGRVWPSGQVIGGQRHCDLIAEHQVRRNPAVRTACDPLFPVVQGQAVEQMLTGWPETNDTIPLPGAGLR